MDSNNDVVEMQRGLSQHPDFSPLGLRLLLPIDPCGEGLDELWKHIVECDYAFDDFSRGKVEVWAASLADPYSLHFKFEDYGYAVVRDLQVTDSPCIHFCTWNNPRFRDVLACGEELVSFVFNRFNVTRITARQPSYCKQAIKFATLLGFKFEGEMRNAIKSYGKHYNVQIHGLLKEEWQKRLARIK
jgi:hypothetical protein